MALTRSFTGFFAAFIELQCVVFGFTAFAQLLRDHPRRRHLVESERVSVTRAPPTPNRGIASINHSTSNDADAIAKLFVTAAIQESQSPE